MQPEAIELAQAYGTTPEEVIYFYCTGLSFEEIRTLGILPGVESDGSASDTLISPDGS